MALTLTVLLENRRARGAEKALRAKPGLSLLVQDETTTILFDTGPDDSFRHNAALMGVDLSQLTAVVLSHGHYDHCGGVPWLPDNSRVICHPHIACERYAAFTLAGYTRKIKKLSRENDYSRLQMAYSREPLPLSERFLWSGEISVSAPQAYGVINEHPPQQDYVTDEGVLIYKSDRGLVIITGCGHRGIANIVAHCQKITGVSKIHAWSVASIYAAHHPIRYGKPDDLLNNSSQKNFSAATAPAHGDVCGCQDKKLPRQEMLLCWPNNNHHCGCCIFIT